MQIKIHAFLLKKPKHKYIQDWEEESLELLEFRQNLALLKSSDSLLEEALRWF